ncbi:MAG: TonB-dependent receptor [Sphingomonadales bacterium]|nr:TonB-dependent receptor [Sphingomonadales bacterium]
MKSVIWQRLACSAALGTLAWATGALAEEPATPATSAQVPTDYNADIVVTAQRRSEKLQEVPLSITAITEVNIEKSGIKSFEDYASRVAGLHLSRDSSQSTFTIRGISSSAGGDTTSATAGLYLDDYPLYDTWFRFSSPDVRIFDVQRIEVLRGPQGTLYGATSLSGSIRIITNKPDLDNIHGKAEVTGSTTKGGDASYDVDGMINVPIVAGKVAIRAVGYVRKDGGYVDNTVVGEKNTNEQRTAGGRLYLRVQPNETLNLLASVTYQHDAQDDQSATLYFPPADGSKTEWNGSVLNATKSSLLVTTLNADQEIGGGNLSLTGIYAQNKSRNNFDATTTVFLFGGGMAPTAETRPSNSNTKIAEVRYTSDANKPFRFVLGAYYNSRYRDFRQGASQATLIPIWGTASIYDVYADQRATEIAAFGEGTWKFAPKWEATVGVRVFRNSYHFNGVISGLLNNLFDPLTPQLTNVSNNQSSYTPRFSLSYKPVQGLNLYATASKGYRFGLTNYNSGMGGNVPLPYKSDTLWNYEVGAKASMWGGRVTFNNSLYYINWSNIQLPFRNANGQVYVTNAGDARSYGLESELSFRPNRAFELNAALSVGKAEMTRGNPNVVRRAASIRGPQIIGVQKGDRLPGSQQLSASGGIQYNIRDLGPGDAYIRVDDIYVGASYVDFIKQGSLETGDYNLVNVRVGYKTNRYEVTAFASNVFDKGGIVSAVPNADLLGTDAAFRVRPRTIGVTFRVNY